MANDISSIIGSATRSGTARYAEAHAAFDYPEFGSTGLFTSRAGFGSYRVAAGVDAHHQALRASLLSGINLIDTSANYADGASEELIGHVLQELIFEGSLDREQVVVVSKAGYLQGGNYEMSQRRKSEGRPFPDLVLYGKGLEHCIHPEFLEDQITWSLRRLQLGTIDFLLLHNPEYYLSWAQKHDVELQAARREYLRRIEMAFRYLEREVEDGRIGNYGISSNSFPYPSDHYEFTPLQDIWDMADNISSAHHFRTIQLPCNIYETGAITEKNQVNEESVIDFARKRRLATIINRPLNAFHHHRMIRLADVQMEAESTGSDFIEEMIDQLLDLEQAFLQLLAKEETGDELPPAVGRLLAQHWEGYDSFQDWMENVTRAIVPEMKRMLEPLLRHSSDNQSMTEWVNRYVEIINKLLKEISLFYQNKSFMEMEKLRADVAAIDPDWSAAASLSQLAIRVLRSTAGISSVLVGMRSETYVNDVLQELKEPVEVRERTASWIQVRKRNGGVGK